MQIFHLHSKVKIMFYPNQNKLNQHKITMWHSKFRSIGVNLISTPYLRNSEQMTKCPKPKAQNSSGFMAHDK